MEDYKWILQHREVNGANILDPYKVTQGFYWSNDAEVELSSYAYSGKISVNSNQTYQGRNGVNTNVFRKVTFYDFNGVFSSELDGWRDSFTVPSGSYSCVVSISSIEAGIKPENVSLSLGLGSSFEPYYMSRDVRPIYKKLSRGYKLESGKQFYREKMDGSVKLIKDDFDYIENLPFDTEFKLLVQDLTGIQRDYRGLFYKTDCKWDADDKLVELKFEPDDEYVDILAGLDKTYNLIELAPELEEITLRRRPLIQVYIPGDTVVTNILGGTHWEQEIQTDPIFDHNDLVNDFKFFNSKNIRLIPASYASSLSVDVTGEYTPDFSDIQSYITYDITQNLQIGLLSNYNRSKFNFVPNERVTATGSFSQIVQLTSVFEGSEEDAFENGMSGLSLTYIPERDKNPMYFKLLASYYDNFETERFDLLGFYRLSQVELDLEGEGGLNEVGVLGVGTQQNFARNTLNSSISNINFKGGIELQSDTDDRNNFIQWGLLYQQENISDRINEWERIDSAGYSLPFNEELVLLNEVIKSENTINSSRVEAFVQNSYSILKPNYELKLTAGVRASHWSYNGETNISPRVQLFYQPLNWEKEVILKLSGGYYYQPPFYKEIRRPDGTVNPDVRSQRSLHVVAGLSYDFDWSKISRKKFRLISELYYKKLDDLISYEIDNVRIRYAGENNSTGYVAGLDLRINGEFVPGAESWLNISILKARENITNVQHLELNVGDAQPTEIDNVPRPTDRFVNVSIFFQDYLPANENFKMNLNLTYGSGLPFGVKGNNQVFRNNLRYKPYQRVDIGFAYQLWDKSNPRANPNHPFKFAKNAWLTFEVFNLLDIANVGSITWVKTIGDQQYSIPNFLTSRRVNLKFKIEI